METDEKNQTDWFVSLGFFGTLFSKQQLPPLPLFLQKITKKREPSLEINLRYEILPRSKPVQPDLMHPPLLFW
jgi:hypothetical protein